jgi:pyridoxamine 5'-phosphate oxidase
VSLTPWNEPFDRFAALFAEARAVIPQDPNAMQLATADAEGRPTLRTVLMKDFDTRGWVFFGNRESRKGQQLAARPAAALNFYWPALGAQVRIEGQVAEVSPAESDAYFASRPRESQLGAWASLQSRPLDARATLEERVAELARLHEGRKVPRPPHWGGWRLSPEYLEFWRAHPSRLHWREVYQRDGEGWRRSMLYP